MSCACDHRVDDNNVPHGVKDSKASEVDITWIDGDVVKLEDYAGQDELQGGYFRTDVRS